MWSAIASASDCSRTSIGLKPLNEPFFGQYQGQAGGLYPGGVNKRPAAHESAGLAQMAQIVPRNAEGDPDSQNGRIVLLSVGMSNTTQEFSAFVSLANRDADKNPKVVLVDGAQGGWSADRIVADPQTYWNGVEQRIRQAGVTPAQVQAAWVKLADATPSLPFPDDAKKLQGETETILQMLRARYPNTRAAYLSSRIYAGYASSNLNPEPYAYEGAFANRWVIEDQIRNNPDMDYDSGKVPWVSWGPYLWADGLKRRLDGLTWACDELQSDGTHPSPSGQRKVAYMLLSFFKSDTTTRPWFVRPTSGGKAAIQAVVNAAAYFPQIATGSIATIFGTELAGREESAPQFPLPYGLAGTSVTVGDEPAPLIYASPKQINFIVPVGASATVAVTREGAAGGTADAQLSFYVEGLFSADGSGTGPAATRHANGDLVTAANPARRGETIELYGTGQGIHNPALLIPAAIPIVRVGDVPAQVTYYGPSGGWPGLDQINITIPDAAPAGDAVPVTCQLISFKSNVVTIAVSGNM